MQRDFLSDIELYYSENINNNTVILSDTEARHVSKVMRHTVSDNIYVTNGKGSLYLCEINSIEKKEVIAKIINEKKYVNPFNNIIFCISRVKKSDRFELSLEKAIELGISKFIIFDSERSIARGEKTERWNTIAIAAMKQSLRTFRPKISYYKSMKDILKKEGNHFIFHQNGNIPVLDLCQSLDKNNDYYFYFGPEGGFTEVELGLFEHKIRLTENRLRSETAVITAASLISILNG